MRQTLFEIPFVIGGVPLFGWGILLLLWTLFSLGVLVWLVRQGTELKEVASQALLLLFVAIAIVMLPKVFAGEGVPVRGYGVLMVLGIVSGVGLAMHRARRMGVDPELIFALAFWIFVGGIVGARGFHVVQKWPEYRRDTLPETIGAILNVPQGGLVVYGSLIGAGIAFLLFVRKHGIPPLPLADLIAPSLVLGLMFGRLGCLMNGCCFGGQCSLPWAVTFPPESPPFQRQVERGELQLYGITWNADPTSAPVINGVEPDSPADQAGMKAGEWIATIDGLPVGTTHQAQRAIYDRFEKGMPVEIVTTEFRVRKLAATHTPARSLPVHPTQIYSAVGAGLLCLFLLAYYPYRSRDGEVIALLLTLYPVIRYFEETIRSDEAGALGTSLTISKLVSLVLLAAVAGLWFYIARQPRGSVLPPAVAG